MSVLIFLFAFFGWYNTILYTVTRYIFWLRWTRLNSKGYGACKVSSLWSSKYIITFGISPAQDGKLMIYIYIDDTLHVTEDENHHCDCYCTGLSYKLPHFYDSIQFILIHSAQISLGNLATCK
jgi:hypothetical protein